MLRLHGTERLGRTMYEELVKRLRAQAEVERFFTGEEMLYLQAADAIEELSKRIDRAVELYNRGVERSTMYEALAGIALEPPKEEA